MFVVATIAILIFTAGTMGWFVTKSRIYESVALVLIAFMLFRPDFFMNRIAPPFEDIPPSQIETAVGEAADGSSLRMVVRGPDFMSGAIKQTTLNVPVEGEPDGPARLEAQGLVVMLEDDKALLEEPFPGTPFFETLGNFDFYGDEPVEISSIQAATNQLPKELMFIPAFILLGLIVWLQTGRAARQREVAA